MWLRGNPRSWKSRAVFCVAATAAVALAAGCSSSAPKSGGSSTVASLAATAAASGIVAEATQAVAAARKAPTFVAPGPSFDASKAKGKTVYVIAASVAVPFIADLDTGITDGLKAAGVNTVVLDGQVDPARYTRFLQQAVAQHADLIISQTLPSAAIAAPLANVKAAGIPVIQMFETDGGPLPADMAARGIVAQATECSACAGKLMADWLIMHDNGKVDAVGINQSAVTYGNVQQDATDNELAKCSSCSVKWLDTISALQWAQKVPTLTSTALSDANVNALLPLYDNMATLMIPTINARGAKGRVSISTYNASANILTLVKSGDVGVDMGQSAVWLGWAAADQSLRVLSGVAPVDNENVPLRLFDSQNIGEIDISKPQSTWFDVDFQADYEKLWGLS